MKYRHAKEEDLQLLFDWTNDASTRQNSFNTSLISFDEHSTWFKNKLNDKNSVIYIAYDNNIPIGQIRIDISKEIGNISYSIDLNHRGLGYSYKILNDVINLVKYDYNINVKSIVGKVKYDNIASQKAFLTNNFTQRDDGECFEYTYKY